IEIVLHPAMQSHVNSRERRARIYDDWLVQSSLIDVCDRGQQFAMSVDQILLRILPGFVARIVDGPPVFFVTELRGVALKSSQAGAFPRPDVQRQLPDRVRARDRMRGGLRGSHSFQ